MIVNRGATRMKIGPSGGWTFILFLTLVATLKSVVCAAEKNSLPDGNSNDCGGEYSGYQYTIGSPNYPENYPENRDCVYTLRGSRIAKCDQVFHLQFLDFALPPSENCQQDYLQIGDRSLYCGSVVGIRRYVGGNNSLTLRFHSGEGKGGKGFKILVTTSPCFDPQIDKRNVTDTAEKSATTTSRKDATKNVVDKKIDTQETLELLEAENSYPVYKPETDFTVEDHSQPGRGDQTPLKISNLERNVVKSVEENVSVGLAKNFQLPVHQSQLFRETTQVAVVTPTPGILRKALSPKISAYLFVPPVSEDTSHPTQTDEFARSSSAANVSKVFPKNEVDNFVTPPPAEFILPGKWTTEFRADGATNNTRQRQFVQDVQRVNQKFVVPARSYGVPTGSYYPVTKVFIGDVQTGEVLENPRGNVDCQGTKALDADPEVTANFRENNPTPIDAIGSGGSPGFRANYYPATTYGAPGLSYPGNVPKVNVGFTPSPSYGPPAGNYPGGSVGAGSEKPNGWLPSTNFIPSTRIPNGNVGLRYPNAVPNVGSGWNYPGSGGEYSQCCRSEYSAQRFTLASPGFPALLYSGNSYDCVYTIRPFSSNICQIRFNFQFFNHGSEDSFCTYGHVEIDGRRFCGCKRGVSVVSPVLTTFPKTIGVKYAGYPRTKFNGFLIEVIQEPCANSYPYLSRSKKDVGNISDEVANFTHERTKRNLGYSYPKPNFGLSEGSGVATSWSSENSISTGIHQLLNQGGIGGNLFAPITSCQALSFFDWVNAAKDVYLRGARCVRNGANGNVLPSYPGGWVGGSGNWYPGGGGSGTIVPGYPGSGESGNWYPGGGGSGTIAPGYPGSGGSGSIAPGYPGSGGSGTIAPGYPGSGGSGTIVPGYPGNAGSGNWYPGNGGSGYPGSGGSGTINPGSGGWNGLSSTKCEDVNVVEGIISSPQYPTNYPNNVNKCFRFYKAPESCQLELVFLDFDLENSNGCSKDYVALSGQNRRYCGRSLAGSSSLIDISRNNILEIYFVSDGYGSGRGFSAGFSQIPCRGRINR